MHVSQWDFFYCKDLGVDIERASRASARLSDCACSLRTMDSVLRVASRRARAHWRLDHPFVMTSAMQISWYVSLITACYTQILNPV